MTTGHDHDVPAAGAPREVDLTWLDFSAGRALSDDGRDLVFTEGGAGAGATGATYIRKTDGSAPAVRLGDGQTAQDLSPDRKWALQVWPDRLVLLPVGPGESRTIQDPSLEYRSAMWFPDGKRLIVEASAPGRPSRAYVRDLDGGPPRPVTPEATTGARVSPDGKLVAAVDTKSGRWALYPVEGGEARPVPQIQPGESVIRFDAGGTSLFLASQGLPLRIDRLELASGKRIAWKEIVLADPTGADSITSVQLTPDGKSYCYSFMRALRGSMSSRTCADRDLSTRGSGESGARDQSGTVEEQSERLREEDGHLAAGVRVAGAVAVGTRSRP